MSGRLLEQARMIPLRACTMTTEEQKIQMALKYLEDALVTVNFWKRLSSRVCPHCDVFKNELLGKPNRFYEHIMNFLTFCWLLQ